MNSPKLRSLLLCALVLEASVAGARPLVYRLTTIADGTLGSRSFTRAIVTVAIHTDSRTVTVQQLNGATVYENRVGDAILTIQEAGQRPVTAHIASGQLFTRYDITNGIASIGSLAGGSFYPFVTGCSYYPTCSNLANALHSGYAGDIPTALAAIAASPGWSVNVSEATAKLPATLSAPTFLNGFMGSCFLSGSGNTCLSPLTGIPTVEGQPLYVSDSFQGGATAQFVILGEERDD
jgi:hypothetical protein